MCFSLGGVLGGNPLYDSVRCRRTFQGTGAPGGLTCCCLLWSLSACQTWTRIRYPPLYALNVRPDLRSVDHERIRWLRRSSVCTCGTCDLWPRPRPRVTPRRATRCCNVTTKLNLKKHVYRKQQPSHSQPLRLMGTAVYCRSSTENEWTVNKVRSQYCKRWPRMWQWCSFIQEVKNFLINTSCRQTDGLEDVPAGQ